MHRLFHACQPGGDIRAPLGIVGLPCVPLPPLTITIGTTCTKIVLQAYIVCRNAIVTVPAGGLSIGLYLPGYQGRIGKIERYIRAPKLITRRDPAAFGEN